MNKHSISLFVISLSVIITGCTTASLKELRRTEATGTPFLVALSKEYLAFAESEAAQYDWIDSRHFADKGLLAAYGNDVQPELLTHWKLPKTVLPEMEEARGKLTAKLTRDYITNEPESAARAQFLFDCWVEQQEENWQQEDISSCKEELLSLLGTVAATPDPAPEPVAQEPAAPASTSYIVFFDWNLDMLREDAHSVISDVIKQVTSENVSYEIVLNGHSDTSGGDTYNLELSERRVARVRQALLEGGIAEKSISTFAFGETDPSEATGDGVRSKANRRVEIFIND